MNAALNIDWLRSLLSYDQDTGHFRWLVRRGSRAEAGSIAGRIVVRGYRHIKIDGQNYLAHRLAWFYATGAWPQFCIDHINGDPGDNRLANLRDVSHAVNMQNRRQASRSSSTGLLGVSYKRREKKFSAAIRCKRKTFEIGTFASPELAHEAYLEAKRRLHPGCTI